MVWKRIFTILSDDLYKHPQYGLGGDLWKSKHITYLETTKGAENNQHGRNPDMTSMQIPGWEQFLTDHSNL